MKPVDVLLALAVPLIWGMGFVIAKAAMAHFSPILLMGLRFTLTALCLAGFFRPPARLFWPLFRVALVSAALQYSLTFYGVRGIDAGTAALLVQLEVPFALLLAWLVLGEKISARQVAGVVVAFAGALLIIGEPRLSGDLVYVFLVIAGALTWAIGQIMIKRLGNLGGFRLLSGVALFAAPQLLLASLLFESGQQRQILTADAEAWLAVIYLGVVMTAIGYALWYRLLGRYDVKQVMPFLLLLPLVSVSGGILFLGESLTPQIALGGGLAVGGVALITLRYSRRRSPPAT